MVPASWAGPWPGEGEAGAMTTLALVCPHDPDSGSTGHLSGSRSLASHLWGLRPQSGCAVLGGGPSSQRLVSQRSLSPRTQWAKAVSSLSRLLLHLKPDQPPPVSHRAVLSALSRSWPGSPGLAAHFQGLGVHSKERSLWFFGGRRMGLYQSAWRFCLSLS